MGERGRRTGSVNITKSDLILGRLPEQYTGRVVNKAFVILYIKKHLHLSLRGNLAGMKGGCFFRPRKGAVK